MNYKLNFSYKTGKELKTTEISNDDVSFDLRQTENGLTLTVIPKKKSATSLFILKGDTNIRRTASFLQTAFSRGLIQKNSPKMN